MDTNEIIEINDNDIQIADEAEREAIKQESERQLLVRKLEIATWAEKRHIFKGAPRIKDLNRVWKKLRKGIPLIKAIAGVCSYASWRKWREDYPEVAAMEEQCREERIAWLQEQSLAIASDMERSHMGEVSRDKLMIDAMQAEINRYDKLTELRIKQLQAQNKGKETIATAVQNVIQAPFKINIEYVKPKPKQAIAKKVEDGEKETN